MTSQKAKEKKLNNRRVLYTGPCTENFTCSNHTWGLVPKTPLGKEILKSENTKVSAGLLAENPAWNIPTPVA